MKTKKWQAIVMVTFAWVLWKGADLDISSEYYIEYLGGFETRKECTSGLRKEVNRHRKFYKSISTDSRLKNSVPTVIEYSASGIGSFSFYCAPAQNLSLRDLFYRQLRK